MKKLIDLFLKVLLYSLVFFLLGVCLEIKTSFAGIDISLAYPFLCFITVVCGPGYGFLTGFLGICLESFADGHFSLFFCLMVGLNAAVIGLLCRKMNTNIKKGLFGWREISGYVKSLIFVNFLNWMILSLTATFMKSFQLYISHVSILYPVTYCVSGTLVGLLLIAMYSRSRLTALNFYRS